MAKAAKSWNYSYGKVGPFRLDQSQTFSHGQDPKRSFVKFDVKKLASYKTLRN